MSLKKVLAVVMASAMAIGAFAAHALTLDVAEAANVTLAAEEATLAAEVGAWYTADPNATAYSIGTATELAELATLVNSGTSFQGKTVTLTADIDLGGNEWTPIGKSGCAFKGTFDGAGHIVSNLVITGNKSDVGLFGFTQNGEVKNLTVNNAKVSGYLDVGAVAGTPYTSAYTNIKLTGHVEINGFSYVGGVFGKNLYANATNIVVDVDSTSYVYANSVSGTTAYRSYVGGVVGFMGEGGHGLKYVSSNIKVRGSTCDIGGITGIAHYGNTLESVVCTADVYSDDPNENEIGGISGVWHNANGTTVKFIDCYYTGTTYQANNEGEYVVVETAVTGPSYSSTGTGNLNTSDIEKTNAVASVNGNVYGSITEAIAKANEGDTVKVMPGTYDGGFSVGKNIILEGSVDADGNPTTIFDGDNGSSSSYYRYCIGMGVGTLKNVKIINAWKGIFTESNSGSLTIDNVTIVDACYGIHIAGAKGAEDTVTVINSNIDTSWANSFATGGYKLVIKDNVFTSNDPYYSDGSPVVNSFVPNTTVSDNSFGKNTKLRISSNAAETVVIGTNYYTDGAENALYSDSAKVSINDYYTTPEMTEVAYAPVFVGDNGYYSVQEAINAATNGDIIEIQPGTYEEALRIEKSVTLKGVATKTSGALLMADEKPVIIIKNVTNGGVQYYAPNVTLDNIKFVVAEDAIGSTWNVSAVGYYYENAVNKDGLTITNCDFVNESDISMSAIAANIGRYTVTNNTFKNFTTIVHSFVDHGAVDEVVISGNRFEDVETIANVYYGAPADGTANITVTNNKSTDGSKAKVIIDDYGMTKATPESSYDRVTVSENDSSIFEIHNYSSENFTLVNEGSEKTVYFYRTKSIMERMDGKLPNGVVYVSYAEDFSAVIDEMYIVFDGKFKAEAETVKLIFKPNTSDAEALANSVWDMYLVASDGEIINRLNSGDFTFVLDSANKMAYEIIASNDEVSVNNVAGDRYEFHYDGKTNTETDTALEIKIATVKFTGYGTFTFSVDTTANATNVVHATTYVDNIVDTFVPGGATGKGILDLDDATTGEVTIAVPTRKLTVNVAFPNEVEEVYGDNQQMTVKVSGGDLAEALIYDLGSDVTMNGGAYAVVIEGKLTKNIAYNVEVSGAGYRTARYTVTMTDAKTLNFWNNVKDNAVEVETGKASSAVKKNFLAGDIVADNNINIYDLSAVVSYFATNATTDYAKYVKYDLNRDGKIDSKDVAYVLVSWGN